MKKSILFTLCLLIVGIFSVEAQTLQIFQDIKGKLGYKNQADELVIPYQYDKVWDKFGDVDHIDLTFKNGKVGLVNTKTGAMMEPQFDKSPGFAHGMFIVTKNGKKGVFDAITFDLVVPCEYYDVSLYGSWFDKFKVTKNEGEKPYDVGRAPGTKPAAEPWVYNPKLKKEEHTNSLTPEVLTTIEAKYAQDLQQAATQSDPSLARAEAITSYAGALWKEKIKTDEALTNIKNKIKDMISIDFYASYAAVIKINNFNVNDLATVFSKEQRDAISKLTPYYQQAVILRKNYPYPQGVPAPGQPWWGSMTVSTQQNSPSTIAAEFAKGETAYAKGSYTEAFQWFQRVAEKGNVDAMYNLALMYQDGQGVAQNYSKAIEWYQKAAEKGDADAMIELGLMYEDGLGVAQNYSKAIEWYQKAAEKGNAYAMNYLGRMYEDGLGVAQSYSKAIEWYQKATEKGNVNAMYSLGIMYDDGLGVTQSYSKAIEWYQKAAEKGNAGAMGELGRMYGGGLGVAQSYSKAFEWFQKAAEKGNAYAMNYLGRMYGVGQGVIQSYSKAIEWYQKAAEKGNANAMYNLGIIYEDGVGVAQSNSKAIEWFQKAVNNGHKEAAEALKELK